MRRKTPAERSREKGFRLGRKPMGQRTDGDWLSPMPQNHFLFVVAYMRNGGNQTQAAIEAGYSEKTAREQASKLMRRPHIRHSIIREQQALRAASKLDALEIISGLWLEAKHATKSRDRIRALYALGKFHGLEQIPFRPGIKPDHLPTIESADLGTLTRDQLLALEEIAQALEAARKARLEGAKQIEHDPGDAQVEAALVEEEADTDDAE